MTKNTPSQTSQNSQNVRMPAMGRALSMIARRPLELASDQMTQSVTDTSAPAEPAAKCLSKTCLTAL